MANPSVVIDIAAEYTGKKAFDKASKSTSGLEKNVKSLAKAFAGVFAAQKILAFGKASVKAFAEDDAAAKRLGMTLKNLGLAYGANIGTVNGFISRLEAQTGVLDDELRPAMDRLLRATNDVAKSQELLGLALDIAAGTGKSVTQVSQSLQKAYLGQTAALGRLGVGLSKAELASGDFETIQEKLTKLFAGQAATAADTYQGSLNKLTVAGNNAKETIGKGLVDALGILSNSSTVDPTVSGIDRIANSIANATKSAAKFIAVSKTLFSDMSFFRNDATTAAALRIKQGTGFTTPMTISSQDTQRADKAAADAAAAKIKADKAAAAAKTKADKAAANAKIKADKLAAANALQLKKAESVFDLEKIGVAAALKGKISEEERTRLLLMQAIANEDAKKAEDLQKKLEDIQKKNEDIAKTLAGISTASNPFAAWTTSLDATISSLTKLPTDPFASWTASIAATITKLGELPAVIDKAGNLTARGNNNIPSEPILSGFDGNNAADLAAAATIGADAATKAAISATADALASQAITDKIAASALNGGFASGGSSSMFNPYARTPGSSAGFGTQATPTNITVNIEGMIDTDNFGDVFNQAMLNAIRKGLPQSVAGQLP